VPSLRYLKQNPFEIESIVGLDPDIRALSHARSESVVCGSALDLPFPDSSFDYVIMVSVLHHLVGGTIRECRRNWEQSLLEAERVCRPGGYIMLREGVAVCTRPFQQMVFLTTSGLARLDIGVHRLHIEKGEVLAFLTPADMLRLSKQSLRLELVKYSVEPRMGYSDFSGLMRVMWQWQTCSLTAILYRM
jgi:SAM-dependent methyltransferase